jgi:hypothetical protein
MCEHNKQAQPKANRNAGVMLRDPSEFDPTAPVDPEWERTHHRNVTEDIAAGRPTAIGRLFGIQTEKLAAVQIVGGVQPPFSDGKENGG